MVASTQCAHALKCTPKSFGTTHTFIKMLLMTAGARNFLVGSDHLESGMRVVAAASLRRAPLHSMLRNNRTPNP